MMLTRKDLLDYIETKDMLNDLAAQADAFAKGIMSYANDVVDKVITVELAKINAMIEGLGLDRGNK